MAAYAAAVTGRRGQARRWARQAGEWETRIARHLLSGYGNPRDAAVTSATWPFNPKSIFSSYAIRITPRFRP